MAYAADGGGLDAEPAIRLLGRKGLDAEHVIRFPNRKGLGAEPTIRLSDRKDSIQKRASRLCKMPVCHATSEWPMLRTKGAYTLNLRLGSSIGRVWTLNL